MESLLRVLNLGGVVWRLDDFFCVPHLATEWLPKEAARRVYRDAVTALKRPEFAAFEIRFCEVEEKINLRIVAIKENKKS